MPVLTSQVGREALALGARRVREVVPGVRPWRLGVAAGRAASWPGRTGAQVACQGRQGLPQ